MENAAKIAYKIPLWLLFRLSTAMKNSKVTSKGKNMMKISVSNQPTTVLTVNMGAVTMKIPAATAPKSFVNLLRKYFSINKVLLTYLPFLISLGGWSSP